VSWQRIRGHDALVTAFERAWRRGRLAQAYLFIGPAGIGKRLFAVELAKAIFCQNAIPDRLEACDRCPSCSQITAGTHPDVFLAGRPPDSPNMPIEVIRELRRNFGMKSATGRGKFAILDDADDLDDPITLHAAANAFLKTLEEPPPRSHLILIGSSADRQLPTIVSRCQIVRCAPLPEELVAELLRNQDTGHVALIERVAQLSGGSPGLARALADPALWEFRRTVLAGLAQPRPNSVALGKALTAFVDEAGKESALQRTRASLVLKLLIDFLQDVLRLSLGGEPRLAEPEDSTALQALAQRMDPERLLEVLERCLEGDVHIDRRVQLVLLLEALLDALGQQLKA
jgi:DNA polymerase III subunit delta'